jgi:hypothetical protein
VTQPNSNWVERKVLREQSVTANAPDVWQSARAAVLSVCDSFNKFSADGSDADTEVRNGHFLQVSIRLKKQSGDSVIRRVAIQFDQRKAIISVTVDGATPKVFPIKADENHCFVEFDGKEITPDRFSEIALSDALYKKPS